MSHLYLDRAGTGHTPSTIGRITPPDSLTSNAPACSSLRQWWTRALLLLAFVLSLPAGGFAQPIVTGTASGLDTVRIMDYNLLNYPGSTAPIRDPHFRAVVHSAKPDVLVALEMTSQAGVTTFLNDVLNYYQAGLYSTITFNDGPDTDPHIYYKASKVTFLGATYFPMSDGIRNVGLFKLRVNSSGDTLFLYAVHLKASTGFEAQRLAEATAIRDTLNKLPAGRKFMLMGDFNVYTSSEGAYVKLLESQADNDGRLKDPINRPGSWNNNASFADIHTQSPRTRSFDGGSNGGMDDRFDFILTAYSALDSNTIVSSYKAYGNDANHFNDSINRLPNTAVPDSVANGLHYSSDHIPVICDFKFGSATGLGAFAMTSPANAATNQPLAGSLTWASASNATGYDVYFGTSSPPTTKVSSNQAGTSYPYGGLAYGTVYHWKVVARSATDTLVATGAPWSFTSTVAPPGAFLMTAPTSGATAQAISGTLSWGSSASATGYDVYLSSSNPPTTKVSANQAGLTYAYGGLTNNTTYYWKVVARNTADTIVATGAPWNFTTTIASPGAFTQTSPSAGATNQALSGTLSWGTSPNATGYDVYLDTNAAPTTLVSANQAGTSYGYGGLLNAKTYRWKVVAKNGAGSLPATNAPLAFTTVVAPPSAFNLFSPSSGAVNQPVAGTLSWAVSAGATSYDVYLDTNATPTTLVSAGQAGTSMSYGGLANAVTYRWKVVAKNAGGSTISTGAPWSFTTIIASPAAFALTAPTNGAASQPVAGTLSWAAATGAATYDVYLDTNLSPTTMVSAGQAGTAYAYGGLQHGKAYTWKVVASNVGGTTTSTGAPWNFTTIVAAPGAFSQTAPLDGATGVALSGALTWSASARASSYDVYLDTVSPPTLLASGGQADTSYAYGGLTNGTTYAWKVVATNGSGSTAATGSPRTFTTVPGPPGPFTLLLPEFDALDQPASGTLTWEPSDGATSYDVYLDTGVVADQLVSADQPGTSYAYSGLAYGSSYAWRVVAKNLSGTASPALVPWIFRTLSTYPITATAGPNGAIAPSGTILVNPGTDQAFTWAPLAGYVVDSVLVDGARVDSVGRYTFTSVSASHTIHATFRPVRFPLSVNAVNGSVLRAPDLAEYDSMSVVQLTAVPATGYQFAGWSGDASGMVNPISVTMSGARTITASFTLKQYALAVYADHGTITRSPDQALYDSNSVVQLSATPDSGYAFVAWTVDATGSANPVDVTMNANKSVVAVFAVTATELDVSLAKGWNMVSLPVAVAPATRSALFPGSLSPLYRFDSGYQAAETLQLGTGYWLKLPAAETIHLTGGLVLGVAVPLAAGWNLVGSISIPVPVSTIVSDPPGLVSSAFFGYDGSYQPATDLAPGKAYWVKVASAATIFLNPGVAGRSSARITIDPSIVGPPPPPERDAQAFAPADFGLDQAYPSPFNPTTAIRYRLPVESRVLLRVYNVLGEVVATLADGIEPAGERTLLWNGAELPTGVYFYRLEAVGVADAHHHSALTGKMVLLR